MGGSLTGIMSVPKERIIAYQEANTLVSKVILAVTMDVKENEMREEDYKEALETIEELKEIINKDY